MREAACCNGLHLIPHLMTFDGEIRAELKSWLLEVKQSFKLIDLDRTKWTFAASIYLKGNAKIWYQVFAQVYEEADSIPWDDFEQAIRSRFVSVIDDARSKQAQFSFDYISMPEYLAHWEAVHLQLPDRPFAKTTREFIDGLRFWEPSLCRDLELVPPRTFTDLINRAAAKSSF